MQAFEETCVGDYHRKKALRWTKKEMEDHYGGDAEAVMKHKIQQGLVEDDGESSRGSTDCQEGG